MSGGGEEECRRKEDVKLHEVVSYLKENRQLLQNQYNKFPVEKLMLLLDHQKLKYLELTFKTYPSGLELPTFIFLMKSVLNCPAEENYELVDGLIKLFQYIDLNGDGHMQWNEFTEYVIDSVNSSEKPTHNQNQNFAEDEIIERAYSKLSKQYKLHRSSDINLHKHVVTKALFNGAHDELITLEKMGVKVKIFNADLQLVDKIVVTSDNYFYIIDIAFNEDKQLVGVITTDNRSLFYSRSYGYKLVLSFRSDFRHIRVFYLPLHQQWAFAAQNGCLSIYNIEFKYHTIMRQTEVLNFLAHRQFITCVLEIDDPRILLSASLEGNIKIHYLEHKKEKEDKTRRKEPLRRPQGLRRQPGKVEESNLLTEQFVSNDLVKGGVLGIDFSVDFGRYVISYGFSTYVHLWCPDISLTNGYVGHYDGHSFTIVCARFVKGFPTVISIDEKSNIRIWDVRILRTIQAITCEHIFGQIQNLLVVPKLNAFFVLEKKINMFDDHSFVKKSKQFNIEVNVLNADYNPYNNSFYLFTSLDMRQYDALTGRLKNVSSNLHNPKFQSVLTSCCFGSRFRKFFVGDAGGLARQYNTDLGELIQGFDYKPKEYSKQVRKVLYVPEECLLVLAYADAKVLLYDLSDSEKAKLIKELVGLHNSELTDIALSYHLGLLVTSACSPHFNVLNYHNGNVEAVLAGDSHVLCLSFADPFPLIAAGCKSGLVCLWSVRPHPSKYSCLLVVKTRASVRTIQLKRYRISDLDLPEQEFQCDKGVIQDTYMKLFVGDENGFLSAYNLNDISATVIKAERFESKIVGYYKREEKIDVQKVVTIILERKQKLGDLDLPATSPRQALYYVKAHGLAVQKVKSINDPFLLMTWSNDARFKIFYPTGRVCGCLNTENFKKVFWQVPDTVVKKKLREIELVFYALRIIEKRVLSEEEKQRIRVMMLLNKYLDDSEKRKFYMKVGVIQQRKEVPYVNPVIGQVNQLLEYFQHNRLVFDQEIDRQPEVENQSKERSQRLARVQMQAQLKKRPQNPQMFRDWLNQRAEPHWGQSSAQMDAEKKRPQRVRTKDVLRRTTNTGSQQRLKVGLMSKEGYRKNIKFITKLWLTEIKPKLSEN